MTGEHPFARHYVHAGMIGLDGEKMSKSKGNLVFVSRLRADDVDPSAIRLALFAGHYRDDREWTDELLKQANSRLARWREAVSLPSGPDAEATVDRLRDHLADDLDTPKAPARRGWTGVAPSIRHGRKRVRARAVRAAVDSCWAWCWRL